MKRTVLADTGPLYAAVDPDDAYHARAHRELKRLVHDKCEVVVAYPTLLEAYTLVLYRLGMQAACLVKRHPERRCLAQSHVPGLP